ncbi:hypothetical protein MKEN_01382900 [Mycena kentingensis (nom. inval.)]|nr:hypothetical protein MKEN_01382900 [Mycena kentingensis (nom. inval.)]
MPRAKNLLAAAPSFHLFGDLPLDVGLRVFSHCSPFDLVQLAATSKSNRKLILTHENLWESAHSNLARGECPRLPTRPVIETSGNFSQEAYVLWVFGGGLCSQCSKPITSIPLYFIFHFRSCSAGCRKILMSRQHLYFCPPVEFDALPHTNGLPRLASEDPSTGTMLYASLKSVKNAQHEANAATQITTFNNVSLRGHRPPTFCTFKPRTLTELEEEVFRRQRSRLAIEKNASDLQTWRDLYLRQQAVVVKENDDFIKDVAREEHIKGSRLQRTPTLKRLKEAFERDLEPLTWSVWIQNRTQILKEIDATPKGKVLCQFCQLAFQHDDLPRHVLECRMNVGRYPELRKFPCAQCPRSTRRYTTKGLEQHELNEHASGRTRDVWGWKRCALCPKREREFKSKNDREKHDRDKHSSGQPAGKP